MLFSIASYLGLPSAITILDHARGTDAALMRKAAVTMVGSSGESMRAGDLAKGCLAQNCNQPHNDGKRSGIPT